MRQGARKTQPPFDPDRRGGRRTVGARRAVVRAGRARGHGKTKITVTGFYRTPAFHIAQRRGLFAKEGLDVEFLLVRLAPDHNEGLAKGRWPLTMSSADTMLARTTQDGVDFVLFLEAEEGLDVQLIAQPKYKSLQELRGKLFAADPIDSNYDLVRNKIMRDNGVPESEYRYEVIGNSSMRPTAFLDGKVDAAMLQRPFSDRAIAKGGVLLGKGSDYIPNWPVCCGWGLRKWMEANRSVVVGFTRAMASAPTGCCCPRTGGDDPDPDEGGKAHARLGGEQLLLRGAEMHAAAGIDPQGPRAAHRAWLLQAAAQADRSVLRHELLDRGHRPAGAAAGRAAAQRGGGVIAERRFGLSPVSGW